MLALLESLAAAQSHATGDEEESRSGAFTQRSRVSAEAPFDVEQLARE